MVSAQSYIYAPMVALATLAVATDLRQRRIPNWLNLSLALTGIVQSLLPWTALTPARSAVGLLVGFTIPLLLMALGALGAGDVKFLAGIGAWIGPGPIVSVILVGAAIGGVLAVAQSLWLGRLRQTLLGTAVAAVEIVRSPSLGKAPAPVGAGPMRDRLPYAAAIWLGLLVVLLTPVGAYLTGRPS